MLPFKEENIENNLYHRVFSETTDDIEFIWHRDREDRIIEIIENDNWQLQYDNSVPEIMIGAYYIPKGEFHRIIKGNNDLHILLKKIQ